MKKARHRKGNGLQFLTGGELGISAAAVRRPLAAEAYGLLATHAGKDASRFARHGAPNGVRIPSALGRKKPATAMVTGLTLKLAESWGFEPQIPLWGILA